MTPHLQFLLLRLSGWVNRRELAVIGVRAVEHLRLVLAEVQIATVRNQVLLSMFSDFENFSVFKPNPGTRNLSMKCSTESWPGAAR
jgi:hypothetical protein